MKTKGVSTQVSTDLIFFGLSMYIDFHTHKPMHKSSEIVEIISCHHACREESQYYTIGYHPWWTKEPLMQGQIENIKGHLQMPNCIAIGECGMDKLKGADLTLQQEIFLQQIGLANEAQVPLIMHCVRQYDQALRLHKQYASTDWVIHGYRRNKQLAKTLLDQNIKVSIAPFEGMPLSFLELVSYLPFDMFFIETDSDYRYSIQDRYEMVAKIKKVDIFELQNQMTQNVNNFFKWKNIHFTGSNERNS